MKKFWLDTVIIIASVIMLLFIGYVAGRLDERAYQHAPLFYRN